MAKHLSPRKQAVKQEYERIRRAIIEGAESAAFMELKQRRPLATDRYSLLRESQIRKHVLFEPSNKILTQLGIPEPSRQRKIFLDYLRISRLEHEIGLQCAAAYQKAKKSGSGFNVAIFEERGKIRGGKILQHAVTFFAKPQDLVTYINRLNRSKRRMARIQKSGELPPHAR